VPLKTEDLVFPAAAVCPEPELLFHPDRKGDKDRHPLSGLLRFGPYSRALPGYVLDPLRIAVICPAGGIRRVKNLLAELEARHRPKERMNYLPEFRGFSSTFGIRAVLGEADCVFELSGDLSARVQSAQSPHLVLAEEINRGINHLGGMRARFDVLVILLSDDWSRAFKGDGQDDEFDLHDYVKGLTATRGIPSQILLESSALAYSCRASVMWRLGIALYTKAGGLPWKLADTLLDAAFVGVSYAVRKNANGEPQFVTCCSQVFDSDGTGLEFLTYEVDDVRIERENPFLSRAQMRRVMARSLVLYQQRHGGKSPKSVTVHKSTEFRLDEVDGCFDAWQAVESLDLIQVQEDVAWRAVLLDPPKESNGRKGIPAAYPCVRGSSVQIGGREILLWTQGNAPTAVKGRNYYKEGKGIPRPLQLTRFAGHGTWEDKCSAILGLTKMDWNNDALYDRLPVTMGFAKVLARVVKRIPNLSARPYQFRFFM